MYTEYYVTGSLAAWARAYNLRSAKDAQKEIQELAGQWDKIISDISELKYSWEAIKDGSKTNSTSTQGLREGNSV
jgi:thymidylate synthase (FAD)